MKIFSADQVRKWDAYTIANAPISSIDLMEKAATACFEWLSHNFTGSERYTVFCGSGNNGGDGLAVARMLLQAGETVSIYVLEGKKRTADFSTNLDRLAPFINSVQFINSTDFHVIPTGTIVVDALFGSGLNKPMQGLAADIVDYINQACKNIISIDIPSGLFADKSSQGNPVIHASHTLGFQTPKLAFLMAENNKYTGVVHLLDIGLHQNFYRNEPTLINTIGKHEAKAIYKPRNQFLHKYDFGHALLYAGSKNMMGASILCAKACLRTGAGLVTVFTEKDTQPVMQTALPEAITTTNNDPGSLSKKKSVIGIGPGLELSRANEDLLKDILSGYPGSIVIDASALQMLSANIDLLQQRSTNPVILTPHTGEFEKLFGKTNNDFDRAELALKKSAWSGCYIVLKGHHTLIACPDGSAFFNTTGNAGMATAGSGDVLTGMISGLLAQGYTHKSACLLGVYLHGSAGDLAAEKMSQEALIASDIIDCIGEAYRMIKMIG